MIYDQFSWASKLPEDTFSLSSDIFAERSLPGSLHGANVKHIKENMCLGGELSSRLGVIAPEVCYGQRSL